MHAALACRLPHLRLLVVMVVREVTVGAIVLGLLVNARHTTDRRGQGNQYAPSELESGVFAQSLVLLADTRIP